MVGLERLSRAKCGPAITTPIFFGSVRVGRGHPLLGLWVSTTGGPTWTSCDRCGNTRPSAWLAASDRSIRADPHAVISAGTARARVASDLAGLAHGGLA